MKDQPSGKDSAMSQNMLNTSSNKGSLLSLSNSLLDLDDEIEDEVKNMSERSNSNKQNNTDNSGSGEGVEPIITDSLDLDNSDDLNKIIQKYETLLG
jgi:ABC-type phosphate transport system substrate-binding protein